MTTVYVVMDDGYSDRSVDAVFSTKEKLAAFLKRSHGVDSIEGWYTEVVVDECDAATWPPGTSWQLTVHPLPALVPHSYMPPGQATDGDRIVARPDACTGAWETIPETFGKKLPWPNFRCQFWGTAEEATAYANAKLAEERAKMPPELWSQYSQSYIGRRT